MAASLKMTTVAIRKIAGLIKIIIIWELCELLYSTRNKEGLGYYYVRNKKYESK